MLLMFQGLTINIDHMLYLNTQLIPPDNSTYKNGGYRVVATMEEGNHLYIKNFNSMHASDGYIGSINDNILAAVDHGECVVDMRRPL